MTYYLGFAENRWIKYLTDTSSNPNNYILSPFNFLVNFFMTYYLDFAENREVKYLKDTSSNLNNYILSPFNLLKLFYDLLPRFY